MGCLDHSSRSASNSSQRCSIELRSGLQSSSPTPDSLIHVIVDLSMLEEKETISNLFPQRWEHGIVQNVLVYFTGAKGPSPAPETQPHIVSPPPPNLAQRSQKSTVLATAKARLVHQFARWRSMILHSKEGVSTALPTLCIALGDAQPERLLLGQGNPFHETLHTVLGLI